MDYLGYEMLVVEAAHRHSVAIAIVSSLPSFFLTKMNIG